MIRVNDYLDLTDVKGNIWIVGDIHGMYQLLMNKLQQQGFNERLDVLLSVGDLIDRGPESDNCLDLLDNHWFYAVRGNHEQMMIDTINDPSFDAKFWFSHGGEWFSGCNKNPDYIRRIDSIAKKLPLTRTVLMPDGSRIGMVHAEPPKDWNRRAPGLDGYSVDSILWSKNMCRYAYRRTVEDLTVANIDHVYCGHTITQNPYTKGNISWIDTGAFISNNLTVLKLT